jgi:hypothetical protein
MLLGVIFLLSCLCVFDTLLKLDFMLIIGVLPSSADFIQFSTCTRVVDGLPSYYDQGFIHTDYNL